MRAEELKGFVKGLFGTDDEMLLPQKAHEAVTALAELHAMFNGAAGLLADESKPAPDPELKALLRNVQQLTIAADEQINKAIQSCKRARGQRLETIASVMSRKIMAVGDDDGEESDGSGRDDDEPDFLESPLSQHVTRNGVTVRVDIYGDASDRWTWRSSTPRTPRTSGTSASRPNSRPWTRHFGHSMRSRSSCWGAPRSSR